MAKLFLSVTFIVNTIFAFSQSDKRGYIVNVGDKAPDFEIKLTNGQTFKLSENKGKIVMLQFTASWCGVCRKEMPFIEKEIYQELKGKDFVLVGIDKDETLDKVLKFVEQTKITYPMALDVGGKVFLKFAHPKAGITRNIIINKDGEIVYLTRLFERQEFNEMKKVIFNLLD